LVVPDELRTNDKAGYPAFQAVEDLTQRDGLERFYFRQTGDRPDLGSVDRTYLWPREEDVFLKMISRVLDPRTKDYSFPVAEEFIASLGHDPATTSDRVWVPKRLDLIAGGYSDSQQVTAT
jgi:hypothetical protein